MTEQEIHNICKKYRIRSYTINPDGSIDVDGDVDLYDMGLTKLPLRFNRVNGDFWCSVNYLTTLEGCPKEVGGTFYCFGNNLTSLKGSPEKVGGSFNCGNNQLTTLEGYNGYYDMLYCDNKYGLILKLKRKNKIKYINEL